MAARSINSRVRRSVACDVLQEAVAATPASPLSPACQKATRASKLQDARLAILRERESRELIPISSHRRIHNLQRRRLFTLFRRAQIPADAGNRQERPAVGLQQD